MNEVWIYTLVSVLVVSLISLIGVFTLSLKADALKKILIYLVSFSTGALFGGAFIHLLPEVAEEHGFGMEISLYVLSGIVIAFVIEKFIHWRHCHHPTTDDHPHPFAYMNLVGDGIHNFIDGMIIAASYMVSIPVGIATTVAVALHEIPQEIGDFGVLIHGGFSRAKALFLNFVTALVAVVGAVVALMLTSSVHGLTEFLVPFAAGNFIYVAGSDLIPELKKEATLGKSFLQLLALVLGIAVMAALVFLEVGHGH